jgi:hypothetical protein
VFVDDTRAFVADGAGDAGLEIYDVSIPASPFLLGRIDTPGTATDVVVAGNLAYVSDGWEGLHVIDVSDPFAPVIVGHAPTPDHARGVAASGSAVYVANSIGGLVVVDVSSPASPRVIGNVDTPGNANGVAVAGPLALIADRLWGLTVLTVQCEPAAGVDDGPLTSARVELVAHPNPFEVATRIALDARVPVGVGSVHDVSGRIVRRLVPTVLGDGSLHASWDGRDDLGRTLPAGVYFASFRSKGGAIATARLVRAP